MPSINVNPTDIPTPEDAAYWAEEIAAYSHLPPELLAPRDCVDYVLGKYREDELNLYHHDPKDEYHYMALHPMFKVSLITAVWAHFLWFRTDPGAQWILNFFGVQRVRPFYDGYIYYKIIPGTQEAFELEPPAHDNSGQLVKGYDLWIYRQWERLVDPPCSEQNNAPFKEMVELLDRNRKGGARVAGEWKERVFYWVSERVRNWFLEAQANDRWPNYRRGRTTGAEWVRGVERSKGVPFYQALAKIAKYHHHSYKSRSSAPVRAYMGRAPGQSWEWFDGSALRVVPRTDDCRLFKGWTEDQVSKTFRCGSCRRVRSCVSGTTEGLCSNCYAKQVELGTSMPTLDRCTMLPECKACPDRIDSNTALVNLKQKWNREPRRGPVPR